MFWNFIRWGGTLAIIGLVLAAVFLTSHPDDNATPGVTVVPAQPAESAPQPNKNFNL
jgi:hypothetical protein